MSDAPLMEKISALCKRRGFIFQSSEVYGGLNGFWDYGPLGAELKRNLRDAWWKSMTRDRDDVVGLDATIIMHPSIWKASGHVDTFSDPMVDCLVTKKRFRADQVEPQTGIVYHYTGVVEKSELRNKLAEASWNVLREDGKSLSHIFAEIYEKKSPQEKIAFLKDFGIKEEEEVSIFNSFKTNHFKVEQEFVEKIVNGSTLWMEGMRLELINVLLDEGLKKTDRNFSVLVTPGKPYPSASKIAKEYYRQLGITDPIPILSKIHEGEKVENTTRYNPENGSLFTEPRAFNLMFQTYVGSVQSEESVAYLRPETAQAIFVQFKNVLDSSRQKLPFGICQIGKAFRNEINPRNYTFRSREFEQMELEFFIKPDEIIQQTQGSVAEWSEGADLSSPQPNWGWEMWHRYWVDQRVKFYASIGLGGEVLDFHWQKKEELAHYARACVDILFKFPFGTEELEGIAARGDFDLTQHQNATGKSMEFFDEEAKSKYVPHVIEPSAGLDRLALAILCQAFEEIESVDEKGKKEIRTVLHLHPKIAPVKAGIFPLLKNKPELVAKAKEIVASLRPHMNVFYDEGGSIGKRYARQDEIGTPFGITVDFETFEGAREGEFAGQPETVTLRHRDSGKQERVRIADLPGKILPALS